MNNNLRREDNTQKNGIKAPELSDIKKTRGSEKTHKQMPQMWWKI